MLRKISQVNPAHIEELREFCQQMIPMMNYDVSNYSPNRKRIWLFHEVNLKTSEISLGYFDQRLWAFCQKVYPDCNIGLMSYGGKGLDSDGLIGLHRDHSYSQPMPQARFAHARTVNLGDSIFGYDLKRQGGEVKQYHLKDGEIIEFNCKHSHSLLAINSDIRFGINLWKLNPEKGFKPLF
jgi:hypothetical protein